MRSLSRSARDTSTGSALKGTPPVSLRASLHRCGPLSALRCLLLDLIPGKTFQACCLVLERWRTVTTPNCERRVSGDRVRHALADVVPVTDLLERMAPCVIGLHFGVGNPQFPHPSSNPLAHLHVPLLRWISGI